jgi:hypothetical protein
MRCHIKDMPVGCFVRATLLETESRIETPSQLRLGEFPGHISSIHHDPTSSGHVSLPVVESSVLE